MGHSTPTLSPPSRGRGFVFTEIAPGALLMPGDLPLEAYARPNTFEIDLGAIARCTAEIRASIGPDIHLIATLKANAYGYGLLPAASTVLAAGADAISLVSLDDAIV